MMLPVSGIGGLQALGGGSVAINNHSRPGQPFQVGDQFEVSITGAQPNAQVGADYYHPAGTMFIPGAVFGNTDDSGNFKMYAAWNSEHVGTWVEEWSVGGVKISSLSFTVLPLPGTPGETPVIPEPVATASAKVEPAKAGLDWSSLFSTTNLLIGGAVIVALFLVMRKQGG